MKDFNLELLEKLSLEDSEIDKTTPSKSNRVRLIFTRSEFEKFTNSVNTFHMLSSRPQFIDFVRTIKGRKITQEEVATTIVEPIVNSIDKINGGTKDKKKVSDKPRELSNNFFIKEHPVTDKFTKLYKLVKGKHPIITGLQYNPDKSTCISDARVILNLYFTVKNLKDENKCRKVTQELRSIVPRSLANIESIESGDFSSVVSAMAKELISWGQ